ncbi:hypothetical protein OX283_003515 [Flavobacterium sp. SUN052]|uniref:hypothetical protein n=1 Tax=Flavobacterium sp. SUN052 TaxID=3002441 RepID=UPI00237EBCD7|nr:hypothetical protein [Flavobacterium sp. SUN052]MEC4003711.1 hypothetical protein [Flavobacterium sp. SUN052]
MNKKFLFIVIFLGSFFVNAQDAVKESVSEKKSATAMSLNKRFSAKVLNAYQENSKSKVEDLFTYFQMLTDAKLNDDLKKEVVKNINLLFQNPNTMVIDFTSDSFDKITLQQFIQKLLISEPILFSVSDESRFDSVEYQSWKTGYTVSRTKSGVVSKTNIIQKVYFYETPKMFGEESKVVFSTFLGEM